MVIRFSKKIVMIIFFITSTIFAQEKFNQLDEKGNKHGPWKGVYEDTKYTKYEGQFEHGKEIGVFTTQKSKKSLQLVILLQMMDLVTPFFTTENLK